MKKTIPILLFIGLLLFFPKFTHAGDLPSSECFEAVVCMDGAKNYYEDLCRPAITALADCETHYGPKDPANDWDFSCDDGCFERSDPPENKCPGGIIIGGDCKTLARVVIDGMDNNILKTYALSTLTKLVYADCPDGESPIWNNTTHLWDCMAPAALDSGATCADGEVLSWDSGTSAWECGPATFTHWQGAVTPGDIHYDGGNVGIGTDNPTKDLTIGTTSVPGEMRLSGNFTTSYLDLNSDGIILKKAGTNYFTADSSGNVNAAMSITSGFSVESLLLRATDKVTSPQYCNVDGSICTPADEIGGGLWEENGVDIYYSTGNVGIGTNSPGQKLEVAGDGKFTGGDVSVWSGNKAITLRQDGTNSYLSNKEDFVSNGSDTNGQLIINGSGGVSLRYGDANSVGTEALVVNTSGNVGIGDSTPDAKLDVAGDAIFDGNVGIGTASPLANLHVEGDGTNNLFRARISGSTQFIIDDIGNVGIGTATPIGKLHVAGTSFFTDNMDIADDKWIGLKYNGGRIEFDDQVADEVNILGAKVGIGTTVPNAGFHILNELTLDSFRVDDSVSDTTPFVIDDVGNVGIGASVPDYKLDVVGSIGMDDYIYHNGDSNTYMGFSSVDHIKFYTSGSEQMYINDSSNYVAVGVNGNFRVDGNLDYTGTNTGMSVSGSFNAQSLNGAGSSANTTMTDQNESICFLTKVYVNETDSGDEDAGCYISTLSGSWVLVAYAESGDADAYCSARCLNF